MAPTPDTLVKLLCTGRKHYDHTYTEGLNVCTQPWDDRDCTPGGLYACELKDIFHWIGLYHDITQAAWVEIPADAKVVRFATKVKLSSLILTGIMPVEDAICLAIQAGVNVHADNDQALRWASGHGHAECVRLLLDAGADVHVHDDQPLFLASKNGHTECVLLLLQAGADVHAYYDVALRTASCYGQAECVRLLLQAGADVHAGDNTALITASCYGHAECVRLLLKAGADVHAQDDEALSLATEHGHTEVMHLLLQA